MRLSIKSFAGINQSNAKILEYYKKAQYVYYKINKELLKEHSFLRELLNNELERINQHTLDLKIFRN